jgi:4-phospho-D-threonate 3-dehydrogenase / 4-phospho-D-erythronate 3-dehydrogenase
MKKATGRVKPGPMIAVTMGDPAGIGPEICLKALNAPDIQKLGRVFIIGKGSILQKNTKPAGVTAKRLRPVTEKELKDFKPGRGFIHYLDQKNISADDPKPGQPSQATGQAAVEFLERSVALWKDGLISGVVTAPISKTAVKAAGFKFPGHTEYFAKKTGTKKYAMLFDSPELKVILATVHLPLKDIFKEITTQRIFDCLEMGADYLAKLGVKNPRMAVAGLNPHAGEGGLLGREEIEIIAPAMEEARAEGLNVTGPVSPDIVFQKALKKEFDLVVALYHDQALIPLKLKSFEKAVNVTVGLPLIRTSVAHGTAFDIAGQGCADPGSLIAAIKLAARLVSK